MHIFHHTSGRENWLSWKENGLEKRQDEVPTNDVPALPASLTSIPVSAMYLPDQPRRIASVSFG